MYLLLSLLACVATALSQKKDYSQVDATVQKLGSLNNQNVAIIADTITRNFSEKEQKARAIFFWIANNIAIDPKATKSNDKKNTLPEEVVLLRKTSPLGFSLLVQEMCSLANIRCLSVDGYTKTNAVDIGNPADEINHSWNVVQLGQSPDQWFYIDAAKASGFTDSKMTTFTKQFTGEYFFTERVLFNLDHYADNQAWQLGAGPKSEHEFYALPVISNAAYRLGLQKTEPVKGHIKTSPTSNVRFSFTYNNADSAPKQIFIVTGEEKKQMKPVEVTFKNAGGNISFNYQFKIPGSYPVKIVVDGETILQYFVDSED